MHINQLSSRARVRIPDCQKHTQIKSTNINTLNQLEVANKHAHDCASRRRGNIKQCHVDFSLEDMWRSLMKPTTYHMPPSG